MISSISLIGAASATEAMPHEGGQTGLGVSNGIAEWAE